MILVTGASGTIGSEVVRQLRERGVAVRAMSRRPGYGVYGDFSDPRSLTAAAAGVSALFLVSPPGAGLPANDRAMLAAAPGVERIVKLSAIGTPDEPGDGLGA